MNVEPVYRKHIWVVLVGWLVSDALFALSCTSQRKLKIYKRDSVSNMHHIDYQQISLSELDRLAEYVTSVLPDRLAIGLVGTLGAGKTTWVQSLARQLHIETSDVTSPTFTLLNSHVGTGEYEGKVLHHIDVYRLADEDEFLELGVDELFESDGWTVVEWADRVESCMPYGTLWISLRLSANNEARQMELKSFNGELIESIRTASESFFT